MSHLAGKRRLPLTMLWWVIRRDGQPTIHRSPASARWNQVALLPYLSGQGLVLPLIAVEHPEVYAAERPDGEPNFKLPAGGGGPAPKIGKLEIADGSAHIVIPRLKADFNATIATIIRPVPPTRTHGLSSMPKAPTPVSPSRAT